MTRIAPRAPAQRGPAAASLRQLMTDRRGFGSVLVAGAISLSLRPAHAQALAPLRLVVAIAAGGVPDLMARQLAQQITQDTGRAVYVENRVGAFGTVAAANVKTSPPDGATVLLVESGTYAIAPHVTRSDPIGDSLVPVALIADAPFYLCVNANLGINNVKDFVAYLKAKPGTPYGSSGIGSSHHLAMESLRSQIGTEMVHVPYKGAGQTVSALIAGEVATAFLGYPVAAANAEAGKIRILAIPTARRNPLTPDIPTIGEGGGPPMDIKIQIGTFAHASTPPDIVASLNRDLSKAASSAPVKAKFAQMGIEATDGTVDARQFAVLVKNDYANYGKIVKAINLKLE